MLTRKAVEELLALEAKATPEPWQYDGYNRIWWNSPENPQKSKLIADIPDHPRDDVFLDGQSAARHVWYAESASNARLLQNFRNLLRPLAIAWLAAHPVCPECGGSGIVKREHEEYDCMVATTETCFTCQGLGYTDKLGAMEAELARVIRQRNETETACLALRQREAGAYVNAEHARFIVDVRELVDAIGQISSHGTRDWAGPLARVKAGLPNG